MPHRNLQHFRFGRGRQTAPSVFDPVNLITAGDKGGLWVPDLSVYISSVFQDLSVKANHISAASSPTRPTQAGNGYLAFDGSDDKLSGGVATNVHIDTTKWDVVTAVWMNAVTNTDPVPYGNHPIISDDGANWGIWATIQGGTRRFIGYGWDGNADRVDSAAILLNTPYVIWFRYDGTNLHMRVNNDAVVTAAHTTNIATLNLAIGRIGVSTTLRTNMRWYGAFIRNNLLTSGEVLQLRQWFGNRVGVTITA